jgi:hypothetical protein
MLTYADLFQVRAGVDELLVRLTRSLAARGTASCGTASCGRYSVYLLYWYKSTNADELYLLDW